MKSGSKIVVLFVLSFVLFHCSSSHEDAETEESQNVTVSESLSCIEQLKSTLMNIESFAIGDSLENTESDFQQAIKFYLSTIEEIGIPHQRHYVQNRIAYCYYMIDEEMMAVDFLKQALHATSLHDSTHCQILFAQTNLLLGQCYLYIGNFPVESLEYPAYYYADSAVHHLNQSLVYYQENLEETDKTLSQIHHYLGEVYRVLHRNYLVAEDHYIQSQKITSAKPRDNPVAQLQNLYCLTCNNRDKGDYAKAVIYGKGLLDLASNVNRDDFKSLAFSCLGNIYFDSEQFESARIFIDSAVSLNLRISGKETELATFYNNQIVVLTKLGQLEAAEKLCDQVFDFLEGKPRLSHELPDTYLYKGGILEGLGKSQEALGYYHKSLKARILDEGGGHREIATTYNTIGSCHLLNGSIDSALLYFQKALVSGSISFSKQDYRFNPVLDQVMTNKDIINILENKANALTAKSIITEECMDNYILAFECLQLCDLLIDHTWSSLLIEESKLMLGSKVHPIYEKAIGIAYDINMQSGSSFNIGDVFQFFDKNRYRYLLDNLANEYAYEEALVSDSLVKAIKEIEYGIEYFTQEQLGDADHSLDFNNEILKLTENKEDLILQLENKYPDFFNIKFGANKTDWVDIKTSLHNRNTVIIEFFYGAESIYILSTDGENQSFTRVERDSNLDKAIENTIRQTTAPDINKLTQADASMEYIESSVYIYKVLLKAVLEQYKPFSVEKLIIIPDGELTKLSFESFITKQTNDRSLDFSAQSYLIDNYSISYSFSAGSLLNETNQAPSAKSKVLGFAYGSHGIADLKYSALSGSDKELKSISKLFRGKFFRESKATEANFKKNVSDYGVVHLALHGEADIENDSSTMLVFRQSESDLKDGKLLPYELYNLDLNARLVVLSSCQSGLGKTYLGEGVYSMARAFAYKACLSMVSTLWPAHDAVSADIMSEFYLQLSEGSEIDYALREAKLKHLSEAKGYLAHPALWACYIPVGKMEVVRIQKKHAEWFIILAILPLIISLA
ncbi:MAG: CHAT domain-containing protein [Bacteroidetes bacterium]|nr:CHAT domain-containing protein [Bacteroidota bacterium]MBT7462959.1 CHAT domain-containing protein [Bacteroidota bacterium]